MNTKKVCLNSSFEEGVKNRLLDINLETNPNPDGAAVRAIRRMWLHDLYAREALVEFIGSRISTSGWAALVARDCKAYPELPILSNLFPESGPCVTRFKMSLGKERALSKPEQLSLPI